MYINIYIYIYISFSILCGGARTCGVSLTTLPCTKLPGTGVQAYEPKSGGGGAAATSMHVFSTMAFMKQGGYILQNDSHAAIMMPIAR